MTTASRGLWTGLSADIEAVARERWLETQPTDAYRLERFLRPTNSLRISFLILFSHRWNLFILSFNKILPWFYLKKKNLFLSFHNCVCHNQVGKVLIICSSRYWGRAWHASLPVSLTLSLSLLFQKYILIWYHEWHLENYQHLIFRDV